MIGFVFEALVSPRLGFYFSPALIMAGVFYALPFVFPWLNILISFLAGFLFSFVWSVLIMGMHMPSYFYLGHIFIYLTVVALSMYVVYAIQKK
ncbi:MAG: hypothetical protein Q8P07_03550 [bacterium]|nr:hypothetical protein [bacterium]